MAKWLERHFIKGVLKEVAWEIGLGSGYEGTFTQGTPCFEDQIFHDLIAFFSCDIHNSPFQGHFDAFDDVSM